jgi:hypothetical protein
MKGLPMLVFSALVLLMSGMILLVGISHYGTQRLFTIQDVEKWCCEHNDTLSPTGENCVVLVGNVDPQYCDRNKVEGYIVGNGTSLKQTNITEVTDMQSNTSWLCDQIKQDYEFYNVTGYFEYCNRLHCGNKICMMDAGDYDHDKDGKLDAFEIEIMNQAGDRRRTDTQECYEYRAEIDMDCGLIEG